MLSFLLITLCALFFTGIVNRTRSILSGRKGPGILQPIKNVILLLRKGSIFSNSSSFIFQIAPIAALASTLVAILLVPFGKYPSVISFKGDFILFIYLLALGRFAIILNALDTASSFEGMGASREALYGMLIEPAFLVLLGAFAVMTGHTTFFDISQAFQSGGMHGAILGVLAAFILFNIMLVETSRLPVDDPRTHLELTMIHEVMVLDNSGFDFALITLNSFLKFALFSALIAFCITPPDLSIWIHLAVFFGVELLCAIAVGFFESFRARNRMAKNPSYLISISAIGLLTFIAAIVLSQYGDILSNVAQ
ncbi:MAG: NADH-quinone oxidoreductase subunit H [Prevotellaceae bacterium]|jgi:formate hydrogenlyase subunit 4|nr:NADH-quinone oxidoreductase subunit H [Prevotellaceae bacterium]